MSDPVRPDDTTERRAARRLARELDELNTPRARYQKVLDDWWQRERYFEQQLNDDYMVGGFMEKWSQTPSYTKSKRDRDWGVR